MTNRERLLLFVLIGVLLVSGATVGIVSLISAYGDVENEIARVVERINSTEEMTGIETLKQEQDALEKEIEEVELHYLDSKVSPYSMGMDIQAAMRQFRITIISYNVQSEADRDYIEYFIESERKDLMAFLEWTCIHRPAYTIPYFSITITREYKAQARLTIGARYREEPVD